MSGGIFHCPFKDGDKKALQDYAQAMFSGENIPWKEEGEIPESSVGLAKLWADLSPTNLDFLQSLDPARSLDSTRPPSPTSRALRSASTTPTAPLT
mgnify:CR=1 FL=1